MKKIADILLKYRLGIIIMFLFFILIWIFLINRNSVKEYKEQISVNSEVYEENSEDEVMNSIDHNSSFKNIETIAKDIILTGLDHIRLVTVHKRNTANEVVFYKRFNYDDDGNSFQKSFLPGIDVFFGLNLINLSHYNLISQKKSLLFQHPVLIKTVYYPTQNKDSIEKKAVNRNYFIVTVYDEDTNKDSLINKKDLRKIYHFDAENTTKTILIPKEYSVYKSTFDLKNDAMYIHAKYDENKNGFIDKVENSHIFMINLKNPIDTKRIY